MKIVSVIPLKRGVLKSDLTYFTNLDAPIGHIVTVPIRNKKVPALVMSSKELEENRGDIKRMDFSLKKVSENKGKSIFIKEFLDAIFDTAKYFAQTKGSVIASLIPNVFIEKYDKIAKWAGREISPDFVSNNIRAEKLLLQYSLHDRISIYKTLVRESFARGKSVFVVLPTEFDINKFTNQLSKGIEQFTFSVHSKISERKTLLAYEKIITSSHPVLIIGTPPFLSIPRKDISVIILEHESSSAYKRQNRPYVDLRVFVEIFSSKINAKLIIADELLRFETIKRKDFDNLNPLHPLSFRIDFSDKIEIRGKEQDKEKGSFKIFRDQSIGEIKTAVKNKKNVFIFTLRKGLATETLCRDCGHTISCDKCVAPLVLYSSHQGKKRMFVCNRCMREIDGDTVCASCGSWNLIPLGIGTDTVCEELEGIFTGQSKEKIKIFKLDKESAKTALGAQKIIKEFGETKGAILVGTEMAFFYFKSKTPLSVIASFDSLWSIPNFKMSEKIIQIILSIINNTEEKFIIQTKNENDPAINAIKSGNLLSFVRDELKDRKELNYPPFRRFIKITYFGDKEQTLKTRKMLEETFKEYSPEIFSGFVTKLKGKYVTNALIKINPQRWSLPELSINSTIDENLSSKLLSLPPNFEVLVDPEDLL